MSTRNITRATGPRNKPELIAQQKKLTQRERIRLGQIFWHQNHDRLVALIGEGLTGSQIAAALGTTKNAVIARMRRLKLELAGATGPRPPKPEPEPEPGRFDFPARGSCVWPVGHPGEPEFRFCGRKVEPGSGHTYCADHRQVAYRRQKSHDEVMA